MKESTIETKVCNYAKSKGWLVYKFVSPSNKGVPDRIFMKEGLVFFMEFKQEGKKLTKLQQKIANDIVEQNIKVFVVDNVMSGIRIIDYLEGVK